MRLSLVRLSKIFMAVVGVLLSSSNSFSGVTLMPWSDPECYFPKEQNKKGPRDLLDAFLASDAEG